MSRLHDTAPKPSLLLAAIALAIAHRLRPDWVAIPLQDAAVQTNLSAQRLSRLCSRAISLFETVIGNLTQRGRPPKCEHDADTEATRLRALLEVATSLLCAIPLRGNKVRTLLVGAWLRLQHTHSSLSSREFCSTLGIPERTFRRWRNTIAAEPDADSDDVAAPAPEPAPAPKKNKPRVVRRGRFSFDVTLPKTQFAADTTDLHAFGIGLKLIASQDVGGRDISLLDNVIVDNKEDAEHVEHVLSESLADLAGAQAITDQGTPYMAELTKSALEALEADHAPQREGDPLGKATIERAFGTVKTIAAPLFSLTDRLAEHIPSLRSPLFAKSFAHLVVTFLLRAYQAGARAAHRADEQRGGIDADTLARLAAENREKAHAELRSKRLLLEHIHQTLAIDVAKLTFIRQFSSRPLSVLRAAHSDFSKHAHRNDIHNRTGYFAWFVNKHLDVYCKQLAKFRHQREREQRRSTDDDEKLHREQSWHEHPESWLLHALKTIAAFWLPDACRLVGGGAGPGTAWLRKALARLVELHGPRAAYDIAYGTAELFSRTATDQLGEQGTSVVLRILFQELRALNTGNTNGRSDKIAKEFVAAILARNGPP